MADRLVTDGPIFKSAGNGHDDRMKAPQEEPSAITPDDVRLIQESFRRVESVRASAAERFFRELFSYDETLRGFFPPDRWSREEQLMSDVRGISDGLARPEKFKLANRFPGAAVGARSTTHTSASLYWGRVVLDTRDGSRIAVRSKAARRLVQIV